MGHVLGAATRSDEPNIIQLSKLDVDDDVQKAWLRAIRGVSAAKQSGYVFLQRSYRIFERSLTLRMSTYDAIAVEVAGAVMDWLSTMRIALAHWERRLKESEYESRLSTACKREYDNEFAYRFLYKLRNYAHHMALPVHSMGSDNANGRSLLLNRDSLIQQFDGWGTVKAELVAGPQEIAIGPLIRDGMESMGRIWDVVSGSYGLHNPHTASSILAALEYFRHNHNGAQPIELVFEGDDAQLGEGSKVTCAFMPSWSELERIAHDILGRSQTCGLRSELR